jgi:hypothetical protein
MFDSTGINDDLECPRHLFAGNSATLTHRPNHESTSCNGVNTTARRTFGSDCHTGPRILGDVYGTLSPNVGGHNVYREANSTTIPRLSFIVRTGDIHGLQ